MNSFKKPVALCKGKHIYIQTHNFPDPDAIASAFGLQCLFERNNRECSAPWQISQ